jgi:UDP:flavonoid glycosyltransferase YjiC (YdhE family)
MWVNFLVLGKFVAFTIFLGHAFKHHGSQELRSIYNENMVNDFVNYRRLLCFCSFIDRILRIETVSKDHCDSELNVALFR